ncbi:MAG: hypothetical protein FWE76_01910 [Symbiobacteriaceae bacterium]|nr:hypothetical protein [Symbiobacteriaceae bacterium]
MACYALLELHIRPLAFAMMDTREKIFIQACLEKQQEAIEKRKQELKLPSRTTIRRR